MTFLVKKTKYEIKKIIEIFFNTLCELKFIFFSIINMNGKDNNKNTMIYPAYLKVGKFKNHNKKIKIIEE